MHTLKAYHWVVISAIFEFALHMFRRKHVYIGIILGFWVTWTRNGNLITNKSSPLRNTCGTNTGRHIDSTTTPSFSSSIPDSIISISNTTIDNNSIKSKLENKTMHVDATTKSETFSHSRNSTEALHLNRTVRILCWVLTRDKTYHSQAAFVRKTWGKHCKTLLLFSSPTNYSSIPVVQLDIPDGRSHLYEKTIAAFRYVYEHHINDADYFLKADDDTFVILENLRYFLSAHNPEIPAWFGRQFRWYVYKRYMSGGAGYVLSKGAVKQLYNEGPKTDLCNRKHDAEDVGLGWCFQQLRIPGIGDVDRLDRPRMYYLNAGEYLRKALPWWVAVNDVAGAKSGPEHMSRYSISYHYINAWSDTQHGMYFYVYWLKAFGRGTQRTHLNRLDLTI